MSKVKNSMEKLAREAAQRLDLARQHGEQLNFLPDEAGAPPVDTIERKAGRPKGATNKGSNQMRDYLAARGYRMPEEVIAEIAGITSRKDAITTAMTTAERVLTWAHAGATNKKGEEIKPTPAQRVAMFSQIYTAQLRAADALLPYGAVKPDNTKPETPAVTINIPGARPDPAATALNVTPRLSVRNMPADVVAEMQQNQQLTEDAETTPDEKGRTE